MNLKTLQEKIGSLSDRMKPHYKLYTPREKEILTKAVKLNEEVGELCNDVLSVLQLQRKSKLDKFDKRHIYEEFADVIITAIQLAESAGVDVERAINDKIQKIEKRYLKDHDRKPDG